MFCKLCGKYNPDTEKQCKYCGGPLSKEKKVGFDNYQNTIYRPYDRTIAGFVLGLLLGTFGLAIGLWAYDSQDEQSSFLHGWGKVSAMSAIIVGVLLVCSLGCKSCALLANSRYYY